MLENTTTAELEARIGSLETDLEQAENALSAATEARVGAKRDLDAVTGDAEVATLAQCRSTVLTEMEATAFEYLEMDLGLLLAEEAIRRYRDIHRGPVIEATETAFRELTSGAYETLKTEFDGKQEVLLAIHSTGAARGVSELSKGTRFQLYLALRAAAYEQMIAQGLALPFFCDSVFETFDDDRTRAASKLMERIGRSGQAIYQTHHRHVIDISREICEEPPVVHEL